MKEKNLWEAIKFSGKVQEKNPGIFQLPALFASHHGLKCRYMVAEGQPWISIVIEDGRFV